jgi:outer membrane lipopolysaccharide assembly protein LptE/RlpB
MKALAAILFICTLLACGENVNTQNQLQPSPDSTKFYPTASFFENQMAIIPTMKKNILVFHTKDGKKDSSLLTTEAFEALVKEFISKDITSDATKKHYRETVFQDAATGSYTLSYTAVDTTVMIKGMEILLDEQSNQVQRVFIRSVYRKGNTSIMEQHNWNTAKGLQIIRSFTNMQGYTTNELTEVRWEE